MDITAKVLQEDIVEAFGLSTNNAIHEKRAVQPWQCPIALAMIRTCECQVSVYSDSEDVYRYMCCLGNGILPPEATEFARKFDQILDESYKKDPMERLSELSPFEFAIEMSSD